METQMRNQGDGLYSQIISELKEAITVQDEGTDKKIIRYAKKMITPMFILISMKWKLNLIQLVAEN